MRSTFLACVALLAVILAGCCMFDAYDEQPCRFPALEPIAADFDGVIQQAEAVDLTPCE